MNLHNATWQSDEIVPLMKLEGGFSAIDIWQELHLNSQFWEQNINNKTDQLEQIGVSLRMARRLSHFPAQRWIGFNHSVGWTKEATTALSWCINGNLNDVFTIWNRLNFRVSTDRPEDFYALLLNPDLLPSNNLSTLIERGKHNVQSVCLLIAARKELPDIDIPFDLQKRLPKDVLKLLQSRGYN